MSLTRATQPGLVSPGGGEQAQRHHPASISSESGESLRHVGCYSANGGRGAGKRVVMPSPCAGAALDPPLWTVVPNETLSLSLSLSLRRTKETQPLVTQQKSGLIALAHSRDDRRAVSRLTDLRMHACVCMYMFTLCVRACMHVCVCMCVCASELVCVDACVRRTICIHV
jgi:hypothetical protein